MLNASAVEESNQADTIIFEVFCDYQLYRAASGLTGKKCPDLDLLHLTQMPWPEVSAWRIVSDEMVQKICRSLLGRELVGFQTQADAEAFVITCWYYLKDVRFQQQADGGFTVERQGNITQVQAYSISVDIAVNNYSLF